MPLGSVRVHFFVRVNLGGAGLPSPVGGADDLGQLALHEDLVEDLCDVDALQGGALDVTVFPVDRGHSLGNFVAHGAPVSEVRLVADHDDGWHALLAFQSGLKDITSQTTNLLEGLRIVDGEDQDEGLRSGHGQLPHGRELVAAARVEQLKRQPVAPSRGCAEVSSVQFLDRGTVLSGNPAVEELVDERRLAHTGSPHHRDANSPGWLRRCGHSSVPVGARRRHLKTVLWWHGGCWKLVRWFLVLCAAVRLDEVGMEEGPWRIPSFVLSRVDELDLQRRDRRAGYA